MERSSGRRLYRSERDRVLAGVAGGLGEYFDVDPVLWRIAFVVATLAGGSGILAYIIMAIVIPVRPRAGRAPAQTPEGEAPISGEEPQAWEAPIPTLEEEENRARRQRLAGAIIVALGLIFLLANLGIFAWLRLDYLWPLVLIGLGVYILFGRRERGI